MFKKLNFSEHNKKVLSVPCKNCIGLYDLHRVLYAKLKSNKNRKMFIYRRLKFEKLEKTTKLTILFVLVVWTRLSPNFLIN